MSSSTNLLERYISKSSHISTIVKTASFKNNLDPQTYPQFFEVLIMYDIDADSEDVLSIVEFCVTKHKYGSVRAIEISKSRAFPPDSRYRTFQVEMESNFWIPLQINDNDELFNDPQFSSCARDVLHITHKPDFENAIGFETIFLSERTQTIKIVGREATETKQSLLTTRKPTSRRAPYYRRLPIADRNIFINHRLIIRIFYPVCPSINISEHALAFF